MNRKTLFTALLLLLGRNVCWAGGVRPCDPVRGNPGRLVLHGFRRTGRRLRRGTDPQSVHLTPLPDVRHRDHQRPVRSVRSFAPRPARQTGVFERGRRSRNLRGLASGRCVLPLALRKGGPHLQASDRSRMGIRVPGRLLHALLLRRPASQSDAEESGRASLVHPRRSDRGAERAQCLRTIRHARQRRRVVLRLVRPLFQRRPDRSGRICRRLLQGDARAAAIRPPSNTSARPTAWP